MGWGNLYSLVGFAALIGLAFLTSTNRRRIHWKTIGVGALSLFVLGAVIFWLPPFRTVLLVINAAVDSVLEASTEGTRFLFGPLAAVPGQPGSIGAIIAFQVLPAVVFFSVITAFLYYIGVLPVVVRWCARLVHRGMRLSGAEALASASNIFVGVEASLIVKPYLDQMTRSELLMLLTAGLATIASTVLAFYVSLLRDVFPYIAGHLISASFLSLPASVMIAKILLPEDGQPVTIGRVPPLPRTMGTHHWMGSIIYGAGDGVKLAVGIGGLLLGLLGLVKLIDLALGGCISWVSGLFLAQALHVGLRDILKYVAYPLVMCLGLNPSDWSAAATLIGERWILTEVVSYRDLAEMARSGTISPRGLLVMSYALCGFTHIPSVAIFVGGTAALVPSRRDDLAALGWLALWAATLATLLTGTIAGIFYYGQKGLLG
jgi:CNT family concentrative nucleoside transporter